MPGPDYLAPSANFFFAPSSRKHGLLHSLPAKSMADTLLKQYWLAVHPVATAVHRPSFERQYASFWKDISNGLEPRASLQALVLAAMLSAAVSLSEDTVTTEYGTTKAELVENFKEATEAALSRANVVRTTKLETLQAFVMYLVGFYFLFFSWPILVHISDFSRYLFAVLKSRGLIRRSLLWR